jgi:YaiO family outer membrane protein
MLGLEAAVQCQAAPAAIVRDDVYARAVKERLAGDNADAIAQLQALLAQQPDDVDARLQLGLALRAAGRTADAERELQEVLRRAPDYKDAKLALAQIQWARGDVAGAKATIGPDLIRSPGDAETSAFVARLTNTDSPSQQPQLWRVDASGALSELSQGLPEWREADASLSRKIDSQSAASVSVQALQRFGISETYLEGAYDRGWSGGEVSVAVGGSVNPTFRPVFDVHSEALLNPWASSPWTLAASGSFSRYVVGDVENLSVGADRLVFGDRGKLSARFIVTHDEIDQTLFGYSAGASWRFTPVFDMSASYVDAAENDTGRTVRVRATGVAANLTASDALILHATVTDEARENSYTRVELALGATAKF